MSNKEIIISSDHNGYELKEEIQAKFESEHEVNVEDLGPDKIIKTDDYPEYAFNLAQKVKESNNKKGILLCRSGIGMVIAANKIPGIRASLVTDIESAKMDQKEHNSNILVLSVDDSKETKDYVEIIKAWLETDFAKGRHLRRINRIRFEELKQKSITTKPMIFPTILKDDKKAAKKTIKQLRSLTPMINFDYIDNTIIKGETISIEDTMEMISKFDHLYSIHLMVEKPKKYLQRLNNLNNLLEVYVHAEAKLEDILDQEWSFKLGITYNPETEVHFQTAKKFDLVQFMTIEPGAQGRKFQKDVLKKVKKLREMGFKKDIMLDGGVNKDSLPAIIKSDVNSVVIGSALVLQKDQIATYSDLAKFIIRNS